MTPVPRLDLAPKLKRPLSIWNPLDYLRLLYWVFFFPQALRWYVDRFGGGYIPEGEMNWRKGWELLRQNSIQRQLLFQGLFLTVITPVAISSIFQTVNVAVNWFGVPLGVAGGVVLGVAGGVGGDVAGGVVLGVVLGVAGGVVLGLAGGVPGDGDIISRFSRLISDSSRLISDLASGKIPDLASDRIPDLASGAMYGILLGLVFFSAFALFSLVSDVPLLNVTQYLVFCICLSVALFVGFSYALFGSALPKGKNLASLHVFIALGMAFSIAIVRLDNWLIGVPLNIRTIQNGSGLFPRITLLPLPNVAWRLQNWLQQDWETGLHNVNQLLAYTLQLIPVVQAVNKVLAKTPSEQIIWRVSLLAANPFDWFLVGCASSSLFQFFLDYLLNSSTVVDTAVGRLDTPTCAAAAGFWHLHEKEPAKAVEAFRVVRSLLYGEEIFALAQTLNLFYEAQKLASIAAIQVPSFPREPLLRPVTWKVLTNLRRVVEDIQLVKRSISRSARSLAFNRALGKLTKILNQADTLPQAERGLIIDIAQTWQKSLLEIAGEVGEISITKPVVNPYVVGDPIEGHLFVGREDIIRQLEELWVMGYQLQSVVLYGHRRMGKTSILLNAANCLGSQIQLAYVNLLRLGDSPQGVGEVLMAICDEISQVVKLPSPADADLLNLPYRTFERYLKQVEAKLDGGLIIALDEFEKIEDLIEAKKIPIDFMGFLRGLVQMSSKIAFAFAGLHTLEEMTADYFQPFFASVIPIHVGFQERASTRQILANPDNEDFPLDYIPEALDEIYVLTHGQPYLVQLLGFQLVRGYNDFVFEQGRSRDPVFTVEDVQAVINDPEFFQRGRYYFDGVWGQAARGAEGQQAIIQLLAPHAEGLSLDALAQSTGMNNADLQEALNTLKRHDVVEETQGNWRIMVELFRRWVLQQ
ncbi:AAA family ATPase [Nostoc sp.]|uniref:AAA family ATPase n=1 Tax=Nostoc sp. TaxID=1180 RepID=UPI002FF6EBF6